MHFSLPANVHTALDTLTAQGYEAYIVGGSVRDLMRGVRPHDYDICTSALPEETKACFAGFRVVETGIQHGTVTVLIDHEPFEITTFRTEGDYLDGRHPSSVSFTRDLKNDLMRRDFTINAMAYHPETGLVDLYGGQADIENRCIRCVGDAPTRLTEDALRILRAMRFAAELGFLVEEKTARAMMELRERLELISRERIAAELMRMWSGPCAPEVLERFSDVFYAALPQCREIDLPALARAPLHDATLRTAALLHPNGAETAEKTLQSLKLPTVFLQECVALIAHYDTEIPEADVPLWLSRLGVKQFERLALLRDEDARDRLLREMRRALAEGLPLTLRELSVNGRDLLSLGVQPGKQLGEALTALHERVLKRELPNDRAVLLSTVRSLVETNSLLS